MLVEDHDVGAESLEPPVLLRLQHLPHQRHVVVPGDAHEQDGQVAGDAVRPQTRTGRARSTRSSSAPARSEPSVHEHPRRETLEEHARRRSRCPGGAGRSARACRRARTCATAALGSWYFRASASAVSRSEAMPVANDEPHRRARRQPDPLAQADDRIEHDAGRARQRAAVERLRIGRGSRPRPRKRARSVSHSTGPCGRPSRLSDVERPDAGLVGIAAAGDGRAAPRCRRGTRFRRTACRTPDARGRRPAGARTISA